MTHNMAQNESFSASLGERSHLVLPARLRRRLDLRPGDRFILTVDPTGGFRAATAREQAKRLRGLYREVAAGRSLANELIAERRAEARQEDAE